MSDIYGCDCLALTGRLYFFIPVPRATASPLPWADMLRPFRPSKMYKLQTRDKKGMSRISKELGITREGLYKSFSKDGNPSFLTVVNVLDNLGYGINIYQKMATA